MILETNTFDHALAAILSIQSNGEIRPIAFHSRAFSAAEINYDVHDKELLAIVESFKKWQCHAGVTPYKLLGQLSDILNFN